MAAVINGVRSLFRREEENQETFLARGAIEGIRNYDVYTGTTTTHKETIAVPYEDLIFHGNGVVFGNLEKISTEVQEQWRNAVTGFGRMVDEERSSARVSGYILADSKEINAGQAAVILSDEESASSRVGGYILADSKEINAVILSDEESASSRVGGYILADSNEIDALQAAPNSSRIKKVLGAVAATGVLSIATRYVAETFGTQAWYENIFSNQDLGVCQWLHTNVVPYLPSDETVGCVLAVATVTYTTLKAIEQANKVAPVVAPSAEEKKGFISNLLSGIQRIKFAIDA